MALTFSDLQVLASDWLDDPNNGYYTLSVLKTRLNLALKELQKDLLLANEQWYNICVTADTVANQAIYALPDDFVQLIRLEKLTSGSGATGTYDQIQPITPNQRNLITQIQGEPHFYWLQQNNFVLKPVPQTVQTLHLEYAYRVANMVNQSDVPDCPEQYQEFIAVMAVRDCFIKDNRGQQGMALINEKLQSYRMLLKQTAQERQADGPRMTVATESWDY